MKSNSSTHRRRGRTPMSDINVTPMVDVMLVLLIIFMVSAPLLTVGVPLDLPQTAAKSLDQDKEPLTVSVQLTGKVFLNNTEIPIEELVAKLKAVTDARGGADLRLVEAFELQNLVGRAANLFRGGEPEVRDQLAGLEDRHPLSVRLRRDEEVLQWEPFFFDS